MGESITYIQVAEALAGEIQDIAVALNGYTRP